jgi:hypothetical protein
MTTLDMFVQPTVREDRHEPVKLPPMSPKDGFQGRYTPSHYDKIVRLDDEELAEFVHLDHDEYIDEYRRRAKEVNHGIAFPPNAHAWSYWHKKHDRIVISRGLK